MWINHTPFFMVKTLSVLMIFSALFLAESKAHAQQDTTALRLDSLTLSQDSIFIPDTSKFKTEFRKKFSMRWHTYPHSPLRATIYSAALPGLGQIYNGHKKEGSLFRKYWKVPIVYGGIATCVAFIGYNTKKYHFYKGQYIALNDDDPNTVTDREYDPIQLNKVQEQYHRWMDVSYMCLAGLFVLQIIDANVDAHLFYYDVGDDLSMSVRPSLIYTGEIKPGIGIGLHF